MWIAMISFAVWSRSPKKKAQGYMPSGHVHVPGSSMQQVSALRASSDMNPLFDDMGYI
jgi:hypothetical protein